MPKVVDRIREVRIIVQRGRRVDLRAQIDVYDANTERLENLGMLSGPDQRSIDHDVRTLKRNLERAGHRVNVLER